MTHRMTQRAPSSLLRLWACVGLMVGAAACGEDRDAQVLVQLRTLASENPFADLELLQIQAIAGERVHADDTVAFTGRPVALASLRMTKDLRILVTGLGTDDIALARGEVQPELPGDADVCCVTACFCRVATFDADACTCGDGRCAASCETP